jgi:membrane protein implicated in regulation of membrane protease activity
MLKEMARAFSVVAGALLALLGIALVFLGAAYLMPHLLTSRTGRTPVIVFLVVCLLALQVRRWQAARWRRQQATENRGRGVSPLDLTSGM